MLSNNNRGTKTNYHFNEKKDNPSRVYRLENGKLIDSMMIDYSAFEKKLKRLIWMNENPTRRKAKKYINENGDEIVELLYSFTSHYSYILINVENNIYEISENNFDYEGKQYEFFGNFYSSFSMPKMIMKI